MIKILINNSIKAIVLSENKRKRGFNSPCPLLHKIGKGRVGMATGMSSAGFLILHLNLHFLIGLKLFQTHGCGFEVKPNPKPISTLQICKLFTGLLSKHVNIFLNIQIIIYKT